MKFIDPHIHLFDLSLGQYSWLKPENPPFWSDKEVINNNFSETDINQLDNKKNTELYGFVHIEAGFNNELPWKEIHWLEKSCKGIFRSVATIDLTLPPSVFLKQIAMLLHYQSVVGCRHILDDSAIEILSHKNTCTNLKALSDNQLSFELQMSLSETDAVTVLSKVLKQLPNIKIIINHAGFPPYIIKEHTKSAEFTHWLSGLKMLSEFQHCAIKCSGWEMTNRNYETRWCEQVINTCVTTFGINRVMLSSNFPLCLFSTTYDELWQHHSELSFDTNQIKQLCFENAKYWYKF